MVRAHRRTILQAFATACASAVMPRVTTAQAYPSKPLRWIVGFPPGGGADIVSRIMAPWLSERLGQPVVVENKPGASTNISVQTVVNSPPDGYTLLFVAASAAVNASLFDKLPFSLTRDIAPVSGLIDFPLVLIANPSLQVRSVGELIAHAKANPGKISLASFGTGTTSHVSGELFKMMAGIDMLHVPYRGGAPMIVDLLAGQVHTGIDVMTTALPHIRSGGLIALGVAGKSRFPGLPEVPTIAETVAGYEANSWCGLGVPRGTPDDIIERLNREINAGLADSAIKARLASVATTPIVLTPAAFGAYVAAEVDKLGKVIRTAGVRPE